MHIKATTPKTEQYEFKIKKKKKLQARIVNRVQPPLIVLTMTSQHGSDGWVDFQAVAGVALFKHYYYRLNQLF